MQDEIDIEKLKRGDHKTFQLFFEHFYPKMMALACRFVDEHIAKDLVQELFTSYWENKASIEAANLRSYLYKSLQNSCLNYLKHQTVIAEYEARKRIAETRVSFWIELMERNDGLRPIINRDIRKTIKTSIRKLPPKCRQTFELCYFRDMSHKQIAETMGISVRTVETHIRKAILFLRAEFKDLALLSLVFISAL